MEGNINENNDSEIVAGLVQYLSKMALLQTFDQVLLISTSPFMPLIC